ncbi:type II toxin-antitoxin system HicB family antitoxin [Limosilactobacillus sp. Sa3CUN2]|uniref:Type II toxin-antitoxin system HicB family antitoxin n=1 Tax=Limosilactobacillus avistercoris TaxID=2762243 RepID=A0ABR8PCW8_9LACO|nr:type II toxin-antitoxin system HicB family antitoxin [Limosilactobacillus avistercoris]MBD7895122.1 type II toxin-antitoxin system HicB family antitoxin [Limosilactobacillus avistercoris]
MTNKLLKYKGYQGTVEYSLEDKVLYGKVIGIRSLISYEGKTIDELETDFRESLDDYLEMCEKHGKRPEVSYSGTFNVRIPSKLHEKVAIYSAANHQSLNASVEEALKDFIDKKDEQ